MYACVRTYRHVRRPEEIAARIEAGFVPRLQELPGFKGYHLIRSGDTFTTVSLFETREAAMASVDLAAAWVQECLADLYDGGPPEVALDEVMLAVAA